MTCDRDGIYIAMTGTPLLTKRERSNLKFGDYIHKYFYDKSIADGYTLRIKKEQIKTEARATIIRNLNIEIEKLESRIIYESDDYVKSVSQYIEKDFIDFRFICRNDLTIGGMIVCRSNDQAKKIHEWFKKNSKLTTGLVLSDTDNPLQDNINKNNQKPLKKVIIQIF
ncbi:type I site-specific deoxyribonuclease, HsdR family (plasmid) [Mycoplasmopsis fermentans]|nr:type I site-specific deoxyribonuclease, HsdR family [Mycoplasmopsis fermentans]